MRVAILGAGSLGCLLAGFLSKTKEELWLLDKDCFRANQLNNSGIRIEGVSGNWQAKVKATSDIKQVPPCELIIICVKAYDTKQAVPSIRPLLVQNTRVLSLQNGIGSLEIISEIVGEERVIGGATELGATLIETGLVRHCGEGETIIGRIDGKIPVELRSIRELFQSAGLNVRVSRDIRSLLWSKLLINVGINALTAITGLPNGKLLEFEGTRRILRNAVAEATRVAKRKRIKLIYDDPLAKVEAVCEATANNLSSMLQDVLSQKRTEVDFINSVVVRLAQEMAIPTPVNTLLLDLVRTIELSYNITFKHK
ncbi:MAG: 2-dehydropantoate 2-reductase [Candidatus Omnitrophota bacterium]